MSIVQVATEIFCCLFGAATAFYGRGSELWSNSVMHNSDAAGLYVYVVQNPFKIVVVLAITSMPYQLAVLLLSRLASQDFHLAQERNLLHRRVDARGGIQH